LRERWGERYARIERALDRSHPRMRSMAAQSMLGLEPYLALLPDDQMAAARDSWLTAFTERNRQVNGMLALMPKAKRLEMFASFETMEVVHRQPQLDIPVTLLVARKSNTSSGPDFGDPKTKAAYHAWAQQSRLSRFQNWIENNPQGTLTLVPTIRSQHSQGAASGHCGRRARNDSVGALQYSAWYCVTPILMGTLLWQQAICGVRDTRPAKKQGSVLFLASSLLALRDTPSF